MPEDLEYITQTALIMCDQGAAPQTFVPLHNLTIYMEGCLVATEIDKIPLVNIPSFTICKLTQKPCLPKTGSWLDTFDIRVKEAKTLVGMCTMNCSDGGKIKFMTSGQVPLPKDAEQELLEMQNQAKKLLDDSGYGDSVGETGLVEGMIPVWGSGKDMINDIQTGDGWGAVMNAGFLVWDVASIGVGIFTLGGGTAVMQGAKAGIKGASKAGAKLVSKGALKKLGKEAFQNLSKKVLDKKITQHALDIGCKIRRGCFPSGTLVHTKNKLCPIEKVKVGDLVKAFNENTGDIGYRQVIKTSCISNNKSLIEIHIDNKVIRCTPNHPIWANDSWLDAHQIVIGDSLKTVENNFVHVNKVVKLESDEKVYNFEVGDWNTYFVGEFGILVHNKCYKKVFFSSNPTLKGKVVVHHAVEQQVLKKYPGLFTKAEMHALNNLRGIPKNLNNDLHLSKIRIAWNQFYKNMPNPKKQDFLDYAKFIDGKFGHLFNPPL